jgi:hypothetical protein
LGLKPELGNRGCCVSWAFWIFGFVVQSLCGRFWFRTSWQVADDYIMLGWLFGALFQNADVSRFLNFVSFAFAASLVSLMLAL